MVGLIDEAGIPTAWSIVDKGKFYVGYDDGDSDYDAVGKTGGAWIKRTS